MQIWIPDSVRREVRFRCTVLTGDEERCNKPFFEGEEKAFQRHVVECARKHQDMIRLNSPRVKLPFIYGDERGEQDREEFVKRTGMNPYKGKKHRPKGESVRKRG